VADTVRLTADSLRVDDEFSALNTDGSEPLTIEAAQAAGSATTNFNLLVEPAAASVVTTRTLSETSGSVSVPVGSPFRCGVGFKQGDIPAGTSFDGIDNSGNILTIQADALNNWPDGSLRWCEVRGYTAQAIRSGGTDTLSFVRSTLPFNNALPNVKTPGQLLLDLKSFPGAEDLTIECGAVTSATGTSTQYSDGRNWAAHFNDLAAGPYVQQVNKGPCCMGFRAWGQPTATTGSADKHAHLHVAFYVWLWLNPQTGAIRDVEYIGYLQKRSIDAINGRNSIHILSDRPLQL
jgi:hypothetical protein